MVSVTWSPIRISDWLRAAPTLGWAQAGSIKPQSSKDSQSKRLAVRLRLAVFLLFVIIGFNYFVFGKAQCGRC